MRRALGGRRAAATVSGALLASSSPWPGWSSLAWVALVPLLWAIDGERPRRACALGWLAGLSFFLVAFAWIPGTIGRAGAAGPPIAVLALLAISALLALYVAVFAASLRLFESRMEGDGPIAAVVLWVALEWLRARGPLPCPWNLLGYSQIPHLQLVQIADLTGIYGVSALVVAVNSVLYSALARRASPVRLAVVAALCVAVFAYGHFRRAAPSAERQLRVGLVQPAIDPNQKWDPARRVEVVARQEALSREAAANAADLVVWPEASTPYVFDGDRALTDRMIEFVRELRVPLLFGSTALVSRPLGRGEVWTSLNRSWLLAADGRVAGRYDKMMLVPFGEYVPWPRLFFFVHKVVPGVGDFLPGVEPTLFALGETRFAVLICYEATFPDLARRFVDRGAELLINQTNDAWFGDGGAPRQHLAMAVVRAIENRVPLVRVANTGISAVVTPRGEMAEQIPLGARGVRVVGVAVGRVERTFYTRHGDVFAEAAVLAAVLMVLYAGWIAPRRSPRRGGSAEKGDGTSHAFRR